MILHRSASHLLLSNMTGQLLLPSKHPENLPAIPLALLIAPRNKINNRVEGTSALPFGRVGFGDAIDIIPKYVAEVEKVDSAAAAVAMQ